MSKSKSTKQPLAGKRIIVTRAQEQALEFTTQLTELGAEVIALPTIKIEHPENKQEFAELVSAVHTYDWLVFTSVNGVDKFFQAFFSVYKDARSIGGVKIAAVGSRTAERINHYRYAVDLLPEKHNAEALAAQFKAKEHIENQTVLWVRGSKARRVIFDKLNALGAIVDECVAYQTLPEEAPSKATVESLAANGADIITFASPLSAKYFYELNLNLANTPQIASIGPATSKALKELGHPADVEAKQSAIPSLIEALTRL